MKLSNCTSLTPYLHWGDYKSSDEKSPDVLRIVVVEAEPFATAYSTNIKAEVKSKENNGLFIIPLHNFESANKSLLDEFSKLYREGEIKDGSSIIVHTWMGVSTRDATKPLRRWKITSTS